MDIKRLKHLVALAEERNFARAAQRVHLSQPALSRSVQAAEAELGMRLFDRGTTEVTPTQAGLFVIERAQRVVLAARTLDRDVDMYSEKLVGDLAFGVGPFVAVLLLNVLLPELRRRYPGIRVRTEINTPVYLSQHLRTEALDFIVADTRVLMANEDLDVSPLAKAPAGFYVRTGHPLLDRQTIDPADLRRFGLSSATVPKFARDVLAQLMGLDEETPMPLSLECDDVPTLVRTALATDTILLMVHAAVAEHIATGQLASVSVAGAPALFTDMGIVALRGRTLSPMAEAAIALVRELGPKLAGMG